MLKIYKYLTIIFDIFAPLYLKYRILKKKEDPIRYKEKLSKINTQREKGILVWFHVASVGECFSIYPLLEKLNKENNINKILITTITTSSAEIIKKDFADNKKIIHQFLPLDVPRYINKFLNHWSPDLSIFIESEIWPNLICKIKENKISLLLVNGRITKKTYMRWKFFKKFAKKIFSKFDLCIASNKETENYLKILGANKIKNFGNLKFAYKKVNLNKSLNINLIKKLEEKKIWCCASTHATEELFCAKTHLDLKNIYKNILTIIIPRHIHRIKKIEKDLSNLKLKVNLFSKLENINQETDILLVDTYGDTSNFYDLSNCVFLGGSLIKHGGQNPIEPSKYGCKIFHGPNFENFTEIYTYLNNLGIANQIQSVEDLSKLVSQEIGKEKNKNLDIINKINFYGENIADNILKEIKNCINT